MVNMNLSALLVCMGCNFAEVLWSVAASLIYVSSNRLRGTNINHLDYVSKGSILHAEGEGLNICLLLSF